MAGVPWHFDNEAQAYKVQAGFKFPAIQPAADTVVGNTPDPIALLANAKMILAEGERFLASLRQLITGLEVQTKPPSD